MWAISSRRPSPSWTISISASLTSPRSCRHNSITRLWLTCYCSAATAAGYRSKCVLPRMRWKRADRRSSTSPDSTRTREMTGPATDLPEAWELPSFETYELAARKHDYCLIIPVINEGSRFTDQLRRLAALALPVDVIVADGGSSDGSMGIDGLLLFGVRTLLVKTGPGKLSAQLRMGFAYAIMQGYLGLIIVDGNGKDGVEAVPSFVTALREGYDFVQGSRYVPGGVAINTPLDRTLRGKLFHAPLLSIAARF